MTDKEAMQQALDALEEVKSWKSPTRWDGCFDKEITALRERLAQPEQDGWHTHDLYTDADKDRPDVICDRNGSVTLGLCKRCGRGESQLAEPCDKQPEQEHIIDCPRCGHCCPQQPEQEPVDRFKDFRTNDWGEPIIYDTNEIDEITGFLTGDEGEEDSVTVLHNLVRYLNVVHPGKTMTQVLIETEEAALAAQQQEPVAWRELCRRLYVELFHCDQQMRETLDEDGEPVWTQGKTVRDVLADAKDALETSPPASKPWVGLTPLEISLLWKQHTNEDGPHHNPYDDDGLGFARAIEAKLKEKNQ